MNKRHEAAIMDALTESGPLDRAGLMRVTALNPEAVDDALWRLSGLGHVKREPMGRYRAINLRHSRAVRLGQFVAKIPKMGEEL